MISSFLAFKITPQWIGHQLTQWYFWCFFAVLGGFIAFLVYVIWFVHRDRIRIYANLGDNNVRLFAIHYEEDFVYAVDKRSLSKPRKETLDWFYSSFTPEDKLRIVVWFTELQKENHVVPHYLEVRVKVKGIKQSSYAIINVTSIDYENKIIHLESRLFQNIKKMKKNSKKSKFYVKHSNEMPALLAENESSPRSVYLIKLFGNSDLDTDNQRINHMILTLLASHLVKLLNSKIYLTTLKSNEIAIVDFEHETKDEVLAFAHEIQEEVSKAIFLSSVSNMASFRIGAILERHHERDYAGLIDVAREMAVFLNQTKDSRPVNLYDESQSEELIQKQNDIIANIRDIIEKKDFTCLYTPIINVREMKHQGYHCRVSANNSLLPSIEEMQDYALYNGFIEDFVTSVYKQINSPGKKSEIQGDYILTMNIKPVHYQAVINAHKKSRTSASSDTVFILEDKDIQKEMSSSTAFVTELHKAKLSLGLQISSTNISLPSDILKYFDYFFLDENDYPNLSDNKNLILLRDLVSKLASYKAEIIVINVSSVGMIQVLSDISVSTFAGKLFSPGQDEFPLPDLKKISKLLTPQNN